ncbi:MAG: hypothetical protein J6U10_03870 [Lachnospiraceae bacterium]|nr:hypothetical protein [Lachnospiraceae bacterium]
MKSRKVLCLLLAGLLCITTACGTAATTEKPSPSSGPAPTESQSPVTDPLPEGFSLLKADLKDPGSHSISPLLYGIFLEDINHALDGGMYPELIKNRSFEYGPKASDKNRHGWKANRNEVSFEVVNGYSDRTCLNLSNPNYAVLKNTYDDFAGIYNTGFYGAMPVTKDASYSFSIFLKGLEGYTGPVSIELKAGTTKAFSGTIDAVTDSWRKYELKFTAKESLAKGQLFVQIKTGSVAVDMVSLMPDDTYKGLPVRKDIGEALEAIHPAFMRFPGGCVIEGKGLDTQYSWKDSIGNGEEFIINGKTTTGDVAIRPQSHSIWDGTPDDPYYTTYGIGFYEFFEFCEAIGCEPLPVLNAGMTCPIQAGGSYKYYKIDSPEFKQYVQDALDLVEFCRGGQDTKWGAVRIAMGHKDPFPLHFIAIGNEQWQKEYFEHYNQFVYAFEDAAKKAPGLFEGVELVISNGPVSSDRYAYNYLENQDDVIVKWSGAADEHFYESAQWFFSNNKRYDKYSRTIKTKVFVGEYAAKANNMQAALAEASFMTGLERNSDIVEMACYAPLFANGKANQWLPDLIFFNNALVYGTPNYHVQSMFSNNVGKTYVPSVVTAATEDKNELSGRVGLGSWETKVAYDNLKVVSNKTGEELYSNNFDSEDSIKDGFIVSGSWNVSDGRLVQSTASYPVTETTGEAIYFGDDTWTDYTLTVDGTILSGKEGFLIPICVKGKENNVFWNLGGWANTVSCLQIVSDNIKSAAVDGTSSSVRLKKNVSYKIKVVVSEKSIKCYLNDDLLVDYTEDALNTLYSSVNTCDNGDIIIKLVNRNKEEAPMRIILDNFDAGAYEKTAEVQYITSDNLLDSNSFNSPDRIAPKTGNCEASGSFDIWLAKYSLTIITIKKAK